MSPTSWRLRSARSSRQRVPADNEKLTPSLQRYAASNQCAYFFALRELRVVQNNRLLRLAAGSPER